MSAVDAAGRMTDFVDHYATLARLESATMGEHPAAAALVALVARHREESQALEREQPPRPALSRPRSPGAFVRWLSPDARDDGAAWDAQQATREAWRAQRDALDPRTAAELERWRGSLDPAWLAALEEDREAALRALVARGLYDAGLVDFTLAGGFGDWHRRAAIATD